MLAGTKDLEERKVLAIARVMKASNIGCFPFRGTIKSYAADMRTGLRADVAERSTTWYFRQSFPVWIREHRQDVQELRPHLLLGDGTLNLQAKINLYGRRPGAACLTCFNPAEKDGEKIRALEDQLRKMPAEERRVYLTTRGLDAVAIDQYLAGAPCGGLGEAALRDFVTSPPAEFSAGFVSLGAGLLLASALLRSTAFDGIAPTRDDMNTLNFLNGGFIDAGLAADDSCELGCQAGLLV